MIDGTTLPQRDSALRRCRMAGLRGVVGLLGAFVIAGCGQSHERCKVTRAGSEPINIDQKEGELLLPKTVASTELQGAVPIRITADAILVQDKEVIVVKHGKVDANSKRDGPDGFFIDPLFKSLKEEAKKLKAVERQGGAPFTGDAILAVHKGAPYRLLAEVLYTANQAEFKTYTFALLKLRE